jgi:hypothetical protein
VVGELSSKVVDNAEDVKAKLLPGLNDNERMWWWPVTVNGDGDGGRVCLWGR